MKGDNRLDLPDTSGRTVLHLAAMIQVLDKKKKICRATQLFVLIYVINLVMIQSSGERRLRQRLTSILVEAGAELLARDINGDYPVDLCFRISEATLFD